MTAFLAVTVIQEILLKPTITARAILRELTSTIRREDHKTKSETVRHLLRI